MLQLKNITKIYKSGDEKVEALKGIDLKFRESEFVSILGQSGCGKTTLLNIIGGLDRYTSGDLIINSKSTKKFKDRDWDAYRNYKVGFIFQNYNLIGHQTILSNVELALTIGGISRKERKQRAIKALEQVGLKDKIHKKPNQLSGGQMQRVAIARALVNDPDIILADEPTGALDTKTSVQIMEILKEISKEKLIIMVTHNPDLAEEYSSRIIRILDGLITEDSNPISDTEVDEPTNTNKIGRTSMKFWTALRLSLNNLLTKKGRTILVSFAGSIGIIGIALVQAVSNGFQNYVDYIQEDTLTSYPLTIMQESADATSMLLAMTSGEREKKDSNEVKEEQYISSMLSNITTNDLQSFNNYLKTNYNEIRDDIANISYAYSVEPNIYSKRADEKLPTKLNPSELFSNMLGGGNIMGMSTSVYSQMHADRASLAESYDVLAGHWPEKYDEMIIVLSEPNKISDYLIYSLGLRDYKELEDIVKKVMNGEKANVQNEPLTLSYDDLMKTELKLIFGSDIYKYNENYDIYEDMTENEEYMNNLYSNAINLKIVGIVSAKEGVNSMALNPGVAYTSDLIDYIIDKTKDADIVKKQLETDEIDVISGKRFDSKESDKGLNFADLISVDSEKLQSAFNIKIDQNSIQSETQSYMTDIANSITTDTTPARNAFKDNLDYFANEIIGNLSGEIKEENIDGIVADYLSKSESKSRLLKLEKDYVIPKETFETAYSGLLKGLLQVYINAYKASAQGIDNNSSVGEVQNNQNISQEEIQQYLNDKNISQEDIQKYIENMPEGSNIDLNVIAQSLDSNTITQNELPPQIPEIMDTSELEKQIKQTLISTYLSNSVVEET
ncbi:MAG TPA: ABC transporter, partial [Clostridiales bacterium]|nr:ABC transporter [Clostridiales bacterium]